MPATFAKISAQQMRLLWALARDHGYDSEGLHDLVYDLVGSSSISNLSLKQASLVIDRLQPKRIKPRPNRPGMATQKQIRMIQGIWGDFGRRKFYAKGQGQKALREFLGKRFGVSDIRFLTVSRARAVIEALKSIQRRLG
jgi:hypothetical protein